MHAVQNCEHADGWRIRPLVNKVMQKRNTVNKSRPGKSGKDESNRLSTYFALFGCGLILMSGFFFAGRQHFSSMDYGMKNSRLRKQIEDLRAEKQRLLFAREVSLSPNEIKKSARKAGLFNGRLNSVTGPHLASASPVPKPLPLADESKPTIIKTGSVKSTATRAEKALQVVQPSQKAKLTVSSE